MRLSIGANNLFNAYPTKYPAYYLAEEYMKDSTGYVTKYPTFSLAWALLAESALAKGNTIEAYAYARTGYHRGLDALRRNGWKGFGPVPWAHEPNQGFLRCLAALASAAGIIGEAEEEQRCWEFLADSSPEAYAELKD